MEVKLDISQLKETYDKLDSLLARNSVMKFVANEVMRLSDDYVPFDSGVLKNNAYVVPLGNQIIYPAPYAQYLYEGKLMVDPITHKGAFYDPRTNRYWSRPGVQKILTDKPLHYAGEPKRGAHWAERMWDDYGGKVCKSAEAYIRSML